MRRPLVLVFILLAGIAGLAACGDDGGDDEAGSTASDATTTTEAAEPPATSEPGDDSETDATTVDELDDRSVTADPTPPSPDFLCDLVPTSTVAEVTGQSFAEGETTITYNTRNEETWTSFRCRWEGEGVDQEVTLDITFADGFPSGSVECPQPARDAVEITGAGDPTSWVWEGPLKQAALQACTPEALVEVVADTWDTTDESGAQAALDELAVLVLTGL